MVHIDKNTYAQVSAALIGDIVDRGTADEVVIESGKSYNVYSFSIKLAEEAEERYTGVEYMGYRESYAFVSYKVKDIRLIGVFDADDEPVDTDFDVNRLDLSFAGCFAVIN